VVGLHRVLDKDTWLQPRPVLLADPGQFEFDLVVDHYATPVSSGSTGLSDAGEEGT